MNRIFFGVIFLMLLDLFLLLVMFDYLFMLCNFIVCKLFVEVNLTRCFFSSSFRVIVLVLVCCMNDVVLGNNNIFNIVLSFVRYVVMYIGRRYGYVLNVVFANVFG